MCLLSEYWKMASYEICTWSFTAPLALHDSLHLMSGNVSEQGSFLGSSELALRAFVWFDFQMH